ncbi:MAG: hypothetical protein KAX49_07195 [Halanaerobiales bacterium]|nr:hypothetical protein [Halanaerobiales bacterium]
MSFFANSPTETTPVSANNLGRLERYTEADAGSNGDFYITIDGAAGLDTYDVVYIKFPAATTGTSNARLAIDGDNTYANIKTIRASQLLASDVEGKTMKFYYNGTSWLLDSMMVAKEILASAGVTKTISNLDLVADGGKYRVKITGEGLTPASGSPGAVAFYYNGDTTATNYYHIKDVKSGAAGTVTTVNDASAGFLGDQAAVISAEISVSTAFVIADSSSVIIGTAGGIQQYKHSQYCQATKSNVTSITFTSAANMGAGTKFEIWKEC